MSKKRFWSVVLRNSIVLMAVIAAANCYQSSWLITVNQIELHAHRLVRLPFSIPGWVSLLAAPVFSLAILVFAQYCRMVLKAVSNAPRAETARDRVIEGFVIWPLVFTVITAFLVGAFVSSGGEKPFSLFGLLMMWGSSLASAAFISSIPLSSNKIPRNVDCSWWPIVLIVSLGIGLVATIGNAKPIAVGLVFGTMWFVSEMGFCALCWSLYRLMTHKGLSVLRSCGGWFLGE